MKLIYLLVALAGCDRASSSDDEPSPDAGTPDAAAIRDAETPDAAAIRDAETPDAETLDAETLDAAPTFAEAGAAPLFRFPIADLDRDLIKDAPIFHVDHDPEAGNRIECTNYDGEHFPWCYDGHDGTDFLLKGSFDTMDNGSGSVVAAAGGEVVDRDDGHYDRCHGDPMTADVSCDGHPIEANYVILQHQNGWKSYYWHLKEGSVEVERGEQVRCGEPLGLIGSSGRSTVPHLHFEVVDPGGDVADPFSGEVNTEASLWHEQRTDSGLPGGVCHPLWRFPPRGL